MKLSVGVFFGGQSVEHEVSVISAVQAMHSMDRQKYDVVPFYVTKDGILYTGDALFDIAEYKNIPALLAKCAHVFLGRKNAKEVWAVLAKPKMFSSADVARIDLAFPIVHGAGTEDGSMQGWFESLRLPYVGCDIAASAIGMDKVRQKDVLRAAGVPVLDAFAFSAGDYIDGPAAVMSACEEHFGYPVIIKPAGLGSSVGIKVAADRQGLEKAIDLACEFSTRILAERAITNLREINCAVLGDEDTAIPSACEEPVSAGEILSYGDKYLSGGKDSGMSGATRRLPAELSPAKEAEIKELAIKTFKALGFAGVVRIDFLMDGDTVYVNEPNTIPGSLAFYLFEAAGLPYSQMLDKMIELSLKRVRRESTLRHSFETNIFALKADSKLKGGIKKQ